MYKITGPTVNQTHLPRAQMILMDTNLFARTFRDKIDPHWNVSFTNRVYIKKKPVYHPPAYSEYAKAAASENVETKVAPNTPMVH